MLENGFLKIESMQTRCTPAEWQARVDLAACYRLVAIYGMSDMMANHISARVPGEDGAFLINAYNAFTVDKVLTRYPDLRSIRDFGSLFGNPWKDRFISLLGTQTSLDGIEHGLLRAKGVFDDPRVHFAVNCASVGCPMLREEAYVATRLDAQLEQQARRFLADRTRNRYDASGDRLLVSRIFDWYKEDWTSGIGGVASREQYFSRYATLLTDDVIQQQRIAAQRAPIAFDDYDWSLNDVRP